MVGGTTHNQHQSLKFAPPSSSTAPTTSPEDDEILKRNTDCVYFLASPLTCKKGSECEYRHSDIARVNPRDCFYWLNGNCLNPKCAFRHPPLDGLQGADVAPSVGPSLPAPHLASYAMPKQGVACIFFQKGFCLKGPLCPFLHGPQNPINNKPSQSGSSNPIPDPSKTGFPFPEKPVQEQKLAQHTTSQTAPFSASNGAVDKKVARVVPPPVMNEPTSNKPNRSSVYHDYHVSESDRIANMKDVEEYSREPSPGFDVIVDNEVEESEYSREKDEFGRSRGGHDYDHFNERESCFDVDHVDRLERRPYSRNTRENESDLRYRISKQKKSFDNGLTSVVGHEYGLKNHFSRHHRHDHRQDHSHDYSHDHRHDHRQDQGNLSSRLRGRIKIPGRSISPTNENYTRVEREFDVERRHLSLNQNRLRDRIKVQRDIMSDNNDSNFFGPKRLAELKKHQSNDEQSLGKRKYPKTEDSSSFEGPKPLSEILKRKRGINNNNNNNICVSSVNIEEKEILPAIKEEHNSVTVDIEDKVVDGESVNYGTSEVEKEEGLIDEDQLVDEELEAYDDENGGEYEYEQMEGEEEDYNLDEGEYVEEEEEVVGDEYGKKDNVVYS